MRFLRYIFEIFRTAAADLGRRPLSSVLSIVAMTVALFVLASFLVLMQGVQGALARWSDQAVVEIYLGSPLANAEVQRLVEQLREDPAVRRVVEIGPEEALTEFQELFPDLGDVEKLLDENPFSGSLRLVPARADADEVGRIVALARASPVVDAVRYDQQWLTALAKLGRAVSWFLLGGATVLLLAALVTVGAVVRLALDDKRDEVMVMRLVGAPASFVVGPVLIAGALLGLTGGVLAMGLAGLLRGAVLEAASDTSLAGMAQILFSHGLPWGQMLVLTVTGALAGALAAGLAAGRAALR